MTTPSDLLSAAADRVRDLAAAATPAPWSAGSVDEETGQFFGLYGDFGWTVHGPSGTAELEDTERGLADCRWIATLSPVVAEPLEAMLRASSAAWAAAEKAYAADRAVINPSAGELSGHWGTWKLTLEERVSEGDRQALALAEAILGSGVVSP